MKSLIALTVALPIAATGVGAALAGQDYNSSRSNRPATAEAPSNHNTTRSNKTQPADAPSTGAANAADKAAEKSETIDALDADDDGDTVPTESSMKAKEKANKSKCSNAQRDC